MFFPWLSGWGNVVIWKGLALRINALDRRIWRRFDIGYMLVLDLRELFSVHTFGGAGRENIWVVLSHKTGRSCEGFEPYKEHVW